MYGWATGNYRILPLPPINPVTGSLTEGFQTLEVLPDGL